MTSKNETEESAENDHGFSVSYPNRLVIDDGKRVSSNCQTCTSGRNVPQENTFNRKIIDTRILNCNRNSYIKSSRDQPYSYDDLSYNR